LTCGDSVKGTPTREVPNPFDPLPEHLLGRLWVDWRLEDIRSDTRRIVLDLRGDEGLQMAVRKGSDDRGGQRDDFYAWRALDGA